MRSSPLQEAVVAVTTELTQQIQATRNLTRALHDDIVARIATLGDGRKQR